MKEAPTARRALPFVALVVTYLAAAAMGLQVAAGSGYATAVWLPSGIALAGLLVGGSRLWPAVALAELLVGLANGMSLLPAAVIAVGCTAAALVAACILRRVPGFSPRMDTYTAVLALAAFGAVLGPVLSATVGTLSLHLAGLDEMSAEIWLTWWIGDAAGVLVAAPLILTWTAYPRETWRWPSVLEGAALTVAVVVGGLYVYAAPAPSLYLMFPLAIWAAVRFGARGATTLGVTAFVLSVVRTASGVGPFAATEVVSPLMAATTFTCVLTVTALILAAAVAERQRRLAREHALRLALQVSRDAYRDLTETARDFIWSADLDGTITYLNESGARILGSEPAELVGRLPFDLVTDHPANPDLRELMARLAAGEIVPPLFVQYRTVRGPLWVEMVASVVRGPDGTPTGYRGINRDVDERVRLQEALRRSEARYRGIVESSTALIARFQPDGTLTYVNGATLEMLGLAARQVIGRTIMSFVHSEDLARAAAVLRDLQTGHRFRRTEVRLETARGQRWIEWETTTLTDASGAVAEVLAVGLDMTERRLTEERYRGLVESQRAVVVRLDLDGRVTFLNTAGRRAFDFGHRDPLGASILELTHEDDRDVLLETVQSLTRPPHRDALATRIRTPSGWRWFEWEGCLVHSEAAGIEIQSTGRDVTDQRAAQQMLLESERLASIGTLAAGIAHEINNPAAGILMNAELALAVRDDPARGDVQRRCLESIIEDAQRCGRIASGVLRFAKNEETEKWPIDVNESIRKVLGAMRVHARQRACRLDAETEEALLFAVANPTEIEQVLVNLLTNAVQAAGRGGRVWLVGRETPTTVRIEVRDDGPGIAAEDRARAFDPFYTTRRDRGGTGLGLSVCHGIVTQHGGTIRLASDGRRGTTVIVELPRPSVEEPRVASADR